MWEVFFIQIIFLSSTVTSPCVSWDGLRVQCLNIDEWTLKPQNVTVTSTSSLQVLVGEFV